MLPISLQERTGVPCNNIFSGKLDAIDKNINKLTKFSTRNVLERLDHSAEMLYLYEKIILVSSKLPKQEYEKLINVYKYIYYCGSKPGDIPSEEFPLIEPTFPAVVFRNYCKKIINNNNFDNIFGEHKNHVKYILDLINVKLKIAFKIYINLSLALTILKKLDQKNPEQSIYCVDQLSERTVKLIKILKVGKAIFIPAGWDSNTYFYHSSICYFVKKAPGQIRVYAIDGDKNTEGRTVRSAKVHMTAIGDYVRQSFFMQLPNCFDTNVTEELEKTGKNTINDINMQGFAHLGHIAGTIMKNKKNFTPELFDTPTCAIYNLFTFIYFYVWKELKNNPGEIHKYLEGCGLLFKRFMER